jgi:hypothetical protein
MKFAPLTQFCPFEPNSDDNFKLIFVNRCKIGRAAFPDIAEVGISIEGAPLARLDSFSLCFVALPVLAVLKYPGISASNVNAHYNISAKTRN